MVITHRRQREVRSNGQAASFSTFLRIFPCLWQKRESTELSWLPGIWKFHVQAKPVNRIGFDVETIRRCYDIFRYYPCFIVRAITRREQNPGERDFTVNRVADNLPNERNIIVE